MLLAHFKLRKLSQLMIGLLVGLGVTVSWAAGIEAKANPVPLIVDTDMGPDDWLALAFVIQNPDFELRGITIAGNGLTPCPYAANNAKYLLAMSPRYQNVPVSCGSVWPMDGYASYPSIWHQGGISMLGERNGASDGVAYYEDAPRMLAKLLKESKEPVEIIAIGAMTNIANVLIDAPELKNKVKRITTMGGAVNVPGNLRVHGFTDKHPNLKAEWNYYIDPVAAKVVFESGLPIRLVPLDATNKVPLTQSFIQRLKASPSNPLRDFAARTFDRISTASSNGEYYHWDPLAAVVAADPAICNESKRMKLAIIANAGDDNGLANGQPKETYPLSAFDGKTRKPLSAEAGATVASTKGKTIDVCLHVAPSVFEKKYIDVISHN